MKKLKNKYIWLITLIVSGAILAVFIVAKPYSNAQYVTALNNNFSTEFKGLNNILVDNGFKLGSLRTASCNIGTPNSGLNGILLCDTARSGNLLATQNQIENWNKTSKTIDNHLKKRDWKYVTGYRGDIIYMRLNSIFTSPKDKGIVTIYKKNFPKITCQLIFSTNKDYPHQQFNKVEVYESCEKNS